MSITYEQLMAELERAQDAAPKDGLTTREWAARWGCGTGKARDVIRRAIEEGVMSATIVYRTSPLRPTHRGFQTTVFVHRKKRRTA